MSARQGLAGLIDAWQALLSLVVPSATSAGQGLELAHPWLLLALVPVAGLIAMVAVRERTTRPALLLARGEAAAALPPGLAAWLLRVAFALGAAAAALATLAVAGPRVLGEPDPATTEGIDLVVALDVSGSMRAADFQPKDRLFVAKAVIEDAVLVRPRDRVGLVVFAGAAFTQAPLTHDKGLLRDILEGVRTGVIEDGTAIGDGLATALNRLRDSKAKTRAVILLTDGDNNAGVIAPESATDLGVELGVKVFTILVGKGGQVPYPDGVDLFGEPRFVSVEIPVNPELMKKIATRTGGSYYLATDAASLKSGFQRVLDSLDRSVLDGAPPVREKIQLSPLLLLVAVLCAGLALALWLGRASPVP